jgi:hypothetical protein
MSSKAKCTPRSVARTRVPSANPRLLKRGVKCLGVDGRQYVVHVGKFSSGPREGKTYHRWVLARRPTATAKNKKSVHRPPAKTKKTTTQNKKKRPASRPPPPAKKKKTAAAQSRNVPAAKWFDIILLHVEDANQTLFTSINAQNFAKGIRDVIKSSSSNDELLRNMKSFAKEKNLPQFFLNIMHSIGMGVVAGLSDADIKVLISHTEGHSEVFEKTGWKVNLKTETAQYKKITNSKKYNAASKRLAAILDA